MTTNDKKRIRHKRHTNGRVTPNINTPESSTSSSSYSPPQYTSNTGKLSRITGKSEVVGENIAKNTAIVIYGYPQSISKTEILNQFEKFGKIRHCSIKSMSFETQFDPNEIKCDDDLKSKSTSIIYIAYTNGKSAALALNAIQRFDNCRGGITSQSEYRVKATYMLTKFSECSPNGKDANSPVLHQKTSKKNASLKVVAEFVDRKSCDLQSSISKWNQFEKVHSKQNIAQKNVTQWKGSSSKPTKISPDVLEKSSISLSSAKRSIIQSKNGDTLVRRLFHPPIGSKINRLISRTNDNKISSKEPCIDGYDSPWQIKSPIILIESKDLFLKGQKDDSLNKIKSNKILDNIEKYPSISNPWQSEISPQIFMKKYKFNPSTEAQHSKDKNTTTKILAQKRHFTETAISHYGRNPSEITSKPTQRDYIIPPGLRLQQIRNHFDSPYNTFLMRQQMNQMMNTLRHKECPASGKICYGNNANLFPIKNFRQGSNLQHSNQFHYGQAINRTFQPSFNSQINYSFQQYQQYPTNTYYTSLHSQSNYHKQNIQFGWKTN